MKTMMHRALLVGAMFAAGTLSAAYHNQLTFAKVTTVMKMHDLHDRTQIVATWTVEDPQSAALTHTYHVKIEFFDVTNPANPVPKDVDKVYSLRSLGFQAVDSTNQIISATAPRGTVDFVPPAAAASQASGTLAGRVLYRAGRKLDYNTNQEGIDEDNIGFLQFRNGSVFEFQLQRVTKATPGVTIWDSGAITVRDGHDTEPPRNPPD